MKSSAQLWQFKKLIREKEEGFSLIELVVVVSVLAVLSAIAIPTFVCTTRKARATTALAALKQIQTECAVKKTTKEEAASTFTTSNLQSYEIESDGANSCNGATDTGLIRAITNDTNLLPIFSLDTNSEELTYSFRGQNGTNISDCLLSICLGTSASELSLFNSNFNELVKSGKTLENKFYRNGDSIYVIVAGETWESAQENAKALGGDLATVNTQDENDWLVNKLFGDGKASTKITDKGSAIWLGHKLNNSGNYVSITDDEDLYNNWGAGEYSDGIGKGEQYTILNLYDNSSRDPGSLNTVANQQNGQSHIFYGLAEIKLNEINDVNDDVLD